MKIQIANKGSLYRLLILLLSITALLVLLYFIFLRMPGLHAEGIQTVDKELAQILKADVLYLSETIGPRSFHKYKALTDTANYISDEFRKTGLEVKRHDYKIKTEEIGKSYLNTGFSPDQVFTNISAELKGTEKPDEIIIIGAHYDSVCISNCKGADDNASGVAATLTLARKLAGHPMKKTIRFMAFVNEEPPFFHTKTMGSMVYAEKCRVENKKIIGMIAFDTIGYYSDKENSQKYPPPLNRLYPSKGNFIAFVGGMNSVLFLRDCITKFRKNSSFPSEGAAVPFFVPGSDWSDHWAFAQLGYNAIMITNTAMNRTPYYHTAGDTHDKLDYDRMALLVDGVGKMLAELANE